MSEKTKVPVSEKIYNYLYERIDKFWDKPYDRGADLTEHDVELIVSWVRSLEKDDYQI